MYEKGLKLLHTSNISIVFTCQDIRQENQFQKRKR